MNKCLFILLCLSLWTGQTLAGAPAGRSTSAGISFDRMVAPARFDIWLHESGGYDAADPQKWGRNTLTCQSRTDTTYGACMTAPVWFSANPAAPYAITLRFTHALTRKTVDIKVYGDHYMFINNKVFTFASFVTGGTSDLAAWNREPYFDFYIVKGELDKLTLSGIWTATLKQNLRQWGSASCGGNFNDVNVGCPGYLTIANWQANIRIEVVDSGNQQIYLPAFPHSTPIVNLNLNNFPGRPGGSEIQGKIRWICVFMTVKTAPVRAPIFALRMMGSPQRIVPKVRSLSGDEVEARAMRGIALTIRSQSPIRSRAQPKLSLTVKLWSGKAPTIRSICVRSFFPADARPYCAFLPRLS